MSFRASVELPIATSLLDLIDEKNSTASDSQDSSLDEAKAILQNRVDFNQKKLMNCLAGLVVEFEKKRPWSLSKVAESLKF